MENKVFIGDAKTILKTFPDDSIDCCITSPPYFCLRDYGIEGQIGMEETPDLYIGRLVEVFDEVKRVLKPTGTVWINIGDTYAGRVGEYAGKHSYHTSAELKNHNKVFENIKAKDMIGIPWMLAFALRDIGYYLRQDIIWAKGNPLPESVTDRCTKSHEYIFLLSKSREYYFDYKAIQERSTTKDHRPNSFIRSEMYNYDTKISRNPEAYLRLHTKNCQIPGHHPHTFHLQRELGGADELYKTRNKRDVWNVNNIPHKDAHFAIFPETLIYPCALAGCPEGGIILDPFLGSGTTGVVAIKQKKSFIGIELNPTFAKMAKNNIDNEMNQLRLF